MANLQLEVTTGALRKELNLVLLITMMLGLNIGGALFTLTSAAAGLTGPSLFVAQLISALPVFLALIPYMILTSSAPKTAASYQYAKLFSYPLATAAVMVLLVAIPLGGLPMFALSNAKYFLMLIPGSPQMVPGLPITWAAMIAIITLTVFYIINLVGIKPASYVQFSLVLILIMSLLVFIIPGIPSLKLANFTPLFTGGAIGLIAAAAISYTLLAGGLFGIELSGEVRQARATVPKALAISMVAAFVLYILVEIVASGVIDWQTFAEGNLGTSAGVFLSGPWLSFFIIGGGILACTTTIHAVLAIAGRYVLVFAEDGFFPRFFTHINKKFGTPHWGLTLPYALPVIVLLFITDITILGAMLNFGLLFMVTLVLIAAYRLPKSHPELFEKSKIKTSRLALAATSLIAASLNILFMLLLIYIIFQRNMDWAFWLFVVAIVAGLSLYFFRRRRGLVKQPSL